jgi:hypothetical protein
MRTDVLDAIKRALVVPYHPDKHRNEANVAWASVAESVTKLANHLNDTYKKRLQAVGV